MDVEWAAVLLTFLAAVFGAVLTASVSFVQQRRDAATERQRRADDAERRRQERVDAQRAAEASAREEAKIAARIVQVDVEQAHDRMKRAVENGRYWSRGYALPQDSWLLYREKIARHLRAEDWVTVSRFFRSVANYDAGASVARSRSSDASRAELSDRISRGMQRAVVRAEAVIQILANFAKDDPAPGAGESVADADDVVT